MAMQRYRQTVKTINLTLLMICTLNSYDVIYRLVNPELPDVKVYVTNIEEIDFPLSFRLCLYYYIFDVDRYRDLGYDDSFDFYLGMSMYNESLIGWNGHNEDGSTIGSTEGTVTKKQGNYTKEIRRK